MDLTQNISDNNLSDILSYLDYKSALVFTASTSKSLSNRTSDSQWYYCHLWRQTFLRHGFSLPPEDEKTTIDYKKECKNRLQLFHNLTKKGHDDGKELSSSLPNTFFNFVPVTPDDDNADEYYGDDDDENDENDDELEEELNNGSQPSVDFECSSFVLTTPGTSGELLFLDPFDGSFVLQEFGSQHSQTLLCFDDYYHIDLSEYFYIGWQQNNNNSNKYINNAFSKSNVVLRENEEVEIDFVGIDAKPIFDSRRGVITGTMAAVSRAFCGESDEGEDLKVCTEIITWKRTFGGENEFGERSVCRFRNSYKRMELDPVYERVYVLFPFHEGRFRNFDTQFLNIEETATEEGFVGGSSVVAVYPLEAYPETSHNDDVDDDDEVCCNCKYTEPRHFPEPDFLLKCSNPVSAINVAPGGELILIGTTKGDLEIWKTGEKEGNATRRNIMNITTLLKEKNFGIHNSPFQKDCGEVEIDNPENNYAIPSLTPMPALATEEMEEETADETNPTPVTITSFHFASHRSIDEVGFVTLHYIHGEAWVFIWNRNFEIGATINLPLSARRKPRIHFDGRRLIVCGQDDKGMILLVYHVLNTWEDLDTFHRNNSGGNGGIRDGGDDIVKFVNGIRHDGLGGLEYYDSVYMTANERYIVINTKSGNLLDGHPGDELPKSSGNPTDGLLVIDLQDH